MGKHSRRPPSFSFNHWFPAVTEMWRGLGALFNFSISKTVFDACEHRVAWRCETFSWTCPSAASLKSLYTKLMNANRYCGNGLQPLNPSETVRLCSNQAGWHAADDYELIITIKKGWTVKITCDGLWLEVRSRKVQTCSRGGICSAPWPSICLVYLLFHFLVMWTPECFLSWPRPHLPAPPTNVNCNNSTVSEK